MLSFGDEAGSPALLAETAAEASYCLALVVEMRNHPQVIRVRRTD